MATAAIPTSFWLQYGVLGACFLLSLYAIRVLWLRLEAAQKENIVQAQAYMAAMTKADSAIGELTRAAVEQGRCVEAVLKVAETNQGLIQRLADTIDLREEIKKLRGGTNAKPH